MSFRGLKKSLAFAGLLGLIATVSATDFLPPGHRPLPLGVHALTGARVVVKPGEVIESGTVIIRDGRIIAVGKDVMPPADARVWELNGRTIYAGFIDPYLTLSGDAKVVKTTGFEPVDGNEENSLTAGGVNFFGIRGQERDQGGAGPSYELDVVTPEHRVVDGLAPAPKNLEALRSLGFTAGNVVPTAGVLRGSSAFITLGEVSPNQSVVRPDVFQHVAFDADAAKEDTYPGSLMGVIAVVRQSFFDARHYQSVQTDYALNAKDKPRPAFNPALAALQPAIGKRMPVVFEPGSALMVDRAAHIARELELNFTIVASGQEWRRPDLAKATGAAFIVPVNFPEIPKLPTDDDWESISLDQLRNWDWAPENPALLKREGLEIALTTYGLDDVKSFRKSLRSALDRGLSETDALAALTTIPAKLCGLSDQLGTIEAGKLANLIVVEGTNYFATDAIVREVWIDGRIYRTDISEAKKKDDTKKADEKKSDEAKDGDKPDDKKEDKKKEQEDLKKQRVARSPLTGRGVLAAPVSVLIKNATIWTSGPQGVLTNASLLISDGKVQQVGQFKVELSANTQVIDGTGKHVSPGLIDAHSHSMILGSVNEGTLPSTAMVRIGDVVHSESENIYLQLAGGLTVANLLHGSANPIGGQNSVVKLRDGESPEGMKFAAAPPGIKFALGENVKQSNWGANNVTRFPQTRMGVPTFMANRFTAAQQYLAAWAKYRKDGGVVPRRDLELETLGEIIEAKRLIHCHSYRQDEILIFLRTMEKFGVKVGTLQHILEGYKVADEIAKHGAGASTFSDWWAFKFEVYDAIPYAGSLMRDRGVLVSFNSDSSELARRMYLESAKAVKYGNTPEVEAFKFVTYNPAKQLHIDKYVGSLEQGKDGDFVIWSKAPTDYGTVCLETWIEGKKYFDRNLAPERTAALQKERQDLLAKAKKVSGYESKDKETSGSAAARASFFRRALEQAHSLVSECQDCQQP